MNRLMKYTGLLLTMGMLATPSHAVFVQGQVGPVLAADGTNPTVRLTREGAVANQEVHAKFQEAVARGNSFVCADLGGTPVTTQAGLSATSPALTLYNPSNSGKNLVLIEEGLDVTTSPGAAAGFELALSSGPLPAVGMAGGILTVTNATIQNALTSSQNQPIGQCFRAATLPGAPVAIRYFGGVTGASAISGVQFLDPVDGKIIVGPGTAVSIQSTAAAAIVAHFEWEEVNP